MNPPILDLLREKRKSLGQTSLLTTLAARRQVLLLGSLIGVSIVCMTGLVTLLLGLRYLYLRSRVAQFENVELEVTNLRTRLKAQQARLNGLKATNEALAGSLATVRASSVLLSELQLRTPDGIQLTSATAQGSQLVIKGRARDPNAFTRINAMQLDLKGSPLLEAAKVAVKKAERAEASQGKTANSPSDGTAPVEFEITGPFASLSAGEQLSLLRRHDSAGMVSRLQLLQREGLMP